MSRSRKQQIDNANSGSSRLTIRIPDDWRPHLDRISQDLRVPGRGPTMADAVRALLLEGFAARKIKVTSVVMLAKDDDA